ncbi:hypothetical protein HMPREF1990_00640 [Porphyromonas gingivalis W4087]|nr:hypothetical protein HMPREF1989_01255 [Porphyromonas gingivalis F0566]ERJ90238.1 hypothetical protein HMPREF1990_00640 [Porphyromonas gingivalis W4087]
MIVRSYREHSNEDSTEIGVSSRSKNKKSCAEMEVSAQLQ